MMKEQELPVREIGRLMTKRAKAILMGDDVTADEIKPILMDIFAQMLKTQEKLPNLLESVDLEVIACLLLSGRRVDAPRRV